MYILEGVNPVISDLRTYVDLPLVVSFGVEKVAVLVGIEGELGEGRVGVFL